MQGGTDVNKYKEAKESDRRRKQKERNVQRENALQDPTIIVKIREKKRLEMQTYMQKKRDNIASSNRTQLGKQTQTQTKSRKQKIYNKTYRENKKIEERKKENGCSKDTKVAFTCKTFKPYRHWT